MTYASILRINMRSICLLVNIAPLKTHFSSWPCPNTMNRTFYLTEISCNTSSFKQTYSSTRNRVGYSHL